MKSDAMWTSFGFWRARRFRHGFVNLVPRQHFVRGDVKRVADGTLMTEQADQAFRKIRVVRHRPERRAVAGHDHRLAAPQPVHDGKIFRAVHRHRDVLFVVSPRRADDGRRKIFLPQRAQQPFLAGDFVPGIIPERIRPAAWIR